MASGERLRVVYSKSKEAVYMSHLDSIRVFEQAFLRAGILIEHTNGFNPRPEIVFAHPLSVGIESTGEIMETVLTEKLDTRYFIKTINQVLPSGIIVLSAEYIPSDEKNIMSRVYASKYYIEFLNDGKLYEGKNNREIQDTKELYLSKMKEFLMQDKILVVKKSKDRMERINIKPQIRDYKFLIDGTLEVDIDTGSKSNLNPNYIMTGYNEYADREFEYSIKRVKIMFE